MKSVSKNLDILEKFLVDQKINFSKNFDLSKNSWLKAGGEFQTYIQPKSMNEIKILMDFLNNQNLKFLVIGNISNTIFRDGLIRTPIINLKRYDFMEKVFVENQSIILRVSSGISIFKFSNILSRDFGVSGAEGLVGIPGSIGGGIYMNASSYQSYLVEYLESVDCIGLSGEIINLKKNDLEFKWRSSIFHYKKDLVILNANFRIPLSKKRDKISIEKQIDKIRSHRKNFQEKKLPNLGSLFATKDLYDDIKYVNPIFFILNFFNRLFTKIILKFFTKNTLLNYRMLVVKIYTFFLGLNNFNGIKLSDRTINCVVNSNTKSANEIIKFIKKFHMNIKRKQKLENIILEKIE